jgi:hypothetical protein
MVSPSVKVSTLIPPSATDAVARAKSPSVADAVASTSSSSSPSETKTAVVSAPIALKATTTDQQVSTARAALFGGGNNFNAFSPTWSLQNG